VVVKPAVSLAAVPGRRKATLEMAARFEREGFSGVWLSQVTLYGSPREVREGIEAWYAAGVTTLIVVPSSTRGNQMAALQELSDLYR
jgi:hypothetical protein